MRKILVLILSCAILATVLAGCSGGHGDWGYIEDKGVMIIGYTDYPPMNYIDENGELVGFETEFAKAVCEILGVEPEFIEIEWGSKEMELNAKSIDAVWNGMTITPERAEEMDISVPYMGNSQVLVVRAEDEETYRTATDLTGVSVVAEVGSTLEQTIEENELFANADYTGVDKQMTGIMEVAAGTADMTVVDSTLAEEVLRPGGDFDGLVFIDKGYKEKFGIAFRKDSPVTLEKINGAIKQLQDNGTLFEIAQKYDKAADLLD
ncbi:MAG: transporter substrate-binding domain-containing protein [Oscillospiraceae bacterium]|nr:transporter substrate-binding domain-containing protein [Oscillospiraceae bacterium]